jgi:signal transduction histidine kinase
MDGTILCVDDDATILRALRGLLEKLSVNYTIEIAESGEEALEIEADLRKRGRALSVIIADFIMPGMRGDELLIKLHELHPRAIKIMLTGQSDFEGVKRVINQANLYRFLEKPFDNDDLLLTIKTACTAYETEAEIVRQNVQLKSMNTELEQMLVMLNNQREDLAKSAAQATIGTLVASVSHELATPLSNCLMTAGCLAGLLTDFQLVLDANKISLKSVHRFVATVGEASNLLERNLVRANDLLSNFKQISADQASEQRRTFNLAVLVSEIVDTMKPSLRLKPHKVLLHIPPDIMMDSLPGAIGQIIINLINNAYLHAFENRVDGVFTISATVENENVRLQFSDNGIGISTENLARLLEPFFSTKIGHGGTGLGMSIVENLAKKTLDGTLTISSTVGVGTVFDIAIPLTLKPHKPS